MKIKFHPLEGRSRVATLPYEECRHVLVKGSCPACTGKQVLIAHDIKETAIFVEKHRREAEQHLRDRGAEAWEDVSPDAHDAWKLTGIETQLGEYTATSKAVCLRCRSHVGELRTRFDTLFGRTEDNLIMSGRYGIVIGAGG